MSVLVTGITGFVGGALARQLLAEGIEVVGLVRPSSDRSRLAGLDITFVEGDVLQPESLPPALAGVAGIIHAAGMLGQVGVPESAYHRLHVDGTNNLLAAAEQLPAPPRIVYVSSPGVLGPVTGEAADETAVPAPSNAYERSKAAAEALVQVYAANGLPVVIARPEFMYGPGDLHVLGLFKAVQNGRFFTIDGGQHVCHPTYIDDAVDGMLRCWRNGRSGEIYHITGPHPVTFRELGETIAATLGVLPPRLNLPRRLAWIGAAGLEAAGRILGFTPPLSRTGVAFFSEDRRFRWRKAQQELGYVPQVDLATGCRRTVAWYRQEKLLA